jgi:predicted nucleic acid-binding protein
MELTVGCRSRRELADLQVLIQQMMIVQFTTLTSGRAFSLVQTWFLSHGLQIADALIAATALEHGLPLFTRNVRHFQMIPGLAVIKPY